MVLVLIVPAMPDELMVCSECGKQFAESYLYSKFQLTTCDKCRYVFIMRVLTTCDKCRYVFVMRVLTTCDKCRYVFIMRVLTTCDKCRYVFIMRVLFKTLYFYNMINFNPNSRKV